MQCDVVGVALPDPETGELIRYATDFPGHAEIGALQPSDPSKAVFRTGQPVNHVILTTTDSNVSGGASGHTYTFTRHSNGTTGIDANVIREGKNFKGRVLGLVLSTVGKGVLEKAFKNSVKAIEARNGAVRDGAA